MKDFGCQATNTSLLAATGTGRNPATVAVELLKCLKEIRSWCIPGMDWNDDVGKALLKYADNTITAARRRQPRTTRDANRRKSATR
mgnify:CR=1 FL=1